MSTNSELIKTITEEELETIKATRAMRLLGIEPTTQDTAGSHDSSPTNSAATTTDKTFVASFASSPSSLLKEEPKSSTPELQLEICAHIKLVHNVWCYAPMLCTNHMRTCTMQCTHLHRVYKAYDVDVAKEHVCVYTRHMYRICAHTLDTCT
eukprot:GHVS01001121.1.p1 GENE.GHVS01001121.1~~GHVS01001121.1.p1  ORF type:complete len:152 (-),score=11.50 GHVS01001121.1:754-1209(-)